MEQKKKTLKECEERLSDIKARLKAILLEQEQAIREWNTAFAEENPEDMECVYDCDGPLYSFSLVRGKSRIEVADILADDFENDIDILYKKLMNAIGLKKIINKSWDSFPEHYEDLIVAKAMEVREKISLIKDGSIISLQDRGKAGTE